MAAPTTTSAPTLVDAAPAPRRARLHRPHLGLRARITLAFTLSAAILSTLLAVTTWGLTRTNIVNQRESSATRQTQRDAQVVQQLFKPGTPVESSTIKSLPDLACNPTPPGQALVRGPKRSHHRHLGGVRPQLHPAQVPGHGRAKVRPPGCASTSTGSRSYSSAYP